VLQKEGLIFHVRFGGCVCQREPLQTRLYQQKIRLKFLGMFFQAQALTVLIVLQATKAVHHPPGPLLGFNKTLTNLF
jgi:hypothetical protein